MPELSSLCHADDCPLAVPNPDCAAYVNLAANGIGSAAPSGQSATATPKPSHRQPSTTSSAKPIISFPPSSNLAPSLGAIAGITMGAAAAVLTTQDEVLSARVFWHRVTAGRVEGFCEFCEFYEPDAEAAV